MKSRSLTAVRSIATVACTAALVTLSVASGVTASAEPVAPSTTTNLSVQFTVPVDEAHPDRPVAVMADMMNPFGLESNSTYSVKISCDRGTVHPMTVTDFVVASPYTHGYNIRAQLPASERGHTCVISATAPGNRQMVFAAPSYVEVQASSGVHDPNNAVNIKFAGTIIYRSQTHGL